MNDQPPASSQQLPLLAAYIEPRFLRYIKFHVPTNCWIWTASCDDDGYGRYKSGGRTHQAHRYAYRQLFGDIPPGHVLRHTCHCRQCVNPEHLVPGSQRDNIADRDQRGNAPRGERNGRAVLTAAQVNAIRARLAAGEGLSSIARAYGVSPRCITHIRNGSHWNHLKPGLWLSELITD